MVVSLWMRMTLWMVVIEVVDEDYTLVGSEFVDEDDTSADQFCSDGVKSDNDEINLDEFSSEEVTENVQEQLALWAVENSVPCRKVSSDNLQEQLALCMGSRTQCPSPYTFWSAKDFADCSACIAN